MATSTGVSCGMCLKNGNDKAAIIWCPECESALCDLCRDRHDQSNKTINHKTITVNMLYPRIQIPIGSLRAQLGITNKFDVKKSDTARPEISAFCLLPNKDFVFVDRAGTFTICNNDGSFKDQFSIDSVEANDITSIDNDTIAVAGKIYHVYLINIRHKRKEIRTIPSWDVCFGIEYNKDMLWMGTYGGGLYTANISDYTVSRFFSINGHILYVTISTCNVCMSNTYTGSITLFDPSSNIIWKFRDKKLLDSPENLTSDEKGNIYVLGRHTYNVVFISADGKQSRQLLGREDGIENVSGIHYDKDRKVLITANIFGNVVVYNCPS